MILPINRRLLRSFSILIKTTSWAAIIKTICLILLEKYKNTGSNSTVLEKKWQTENDRPHPQRIFSLFFKNCSGDEAEFQEAYEGKIREKEDEGKLCWRNWMGWLFCLSFKRKAFGEFLCHKKKKCFM